MIPAAAACLLPPEQALLIDRRCTKARYRHAHALAGMGEWGRAAVEMEVRAGRGGSGAGLGRSGHPCWPAIVGPLGTVASA